ncbi:MAG TPA: terminase TerL endonuclease subunit [Bacillota bacterium]|nr:terminase TerL endonuclease subunit [Bacillota bacterium]
MTFLEKYTQQILSGEIIACRRIKQVCRMLADKIEHPAKYKPYIFDEGKANEPIEFIETFCKQAEGEMGKPITLTLFQKALLQASFGFINGDLEVRQYNEVLLIIGRKNGKSTILAAVNLYLLLADGEGAPQIFNLATKAEQAKICFDYTHAMVRQSPALAKHVKKRVSDLYFKYNFGFIRPLASNTKSLDGLNAHAATIDELAAIQNRDLYDLVKQSMSARKQPMLWEITTNGFVRDCIFDAQYNYACNILDGKVSNDKFLPFIYELDDLDEWDKEASWIKANPGLGEIKSKSFLFECVQKAKDDPSFKPTVLVKDFNMKQNSASAWLTWEEINNEATFILKEMGFRYGIGAFDASETTDLTAAKVLMMRPGDENIYIKSMYWLPEELLNRMTTDGNRKERDNVPYLLWKEKGLLRTTPGHKIDKQCILEWFKEVREQDDVYIPWIGYDPWHIDDSLLDDFKVEFGLESMLKVRQGAQSLSDPMKDLKGYMREGKIIHNQNPIDMWCLSNLEVRTDINNNIQPVKNARDNRKRIDGAVALIIGFVVLKDKYNDYSNMI